MERLNNPHKNLLLILLTLSTIFFIYNFIFHDGYWDSLNLIIASFIVWGILSFSVLIGWGIYFGIKQSILSWFDKLSPVNKKAWSISILAFLSVTFFNVLKNHLRNEFLLINFKEISLSYWLTLSFYIIDITLLIAFIIYLAPKDFKILFPLVSKSQNKDKSNYGISLDSKILNQLYSQLEKFEFIDGYKTSYEDFKMVLCLDWNNHDRVLYLNMDNIQFSYFINCFDRFFNHKIQISHIEKAGNVKNKNGIIRSQSIYSSISKSKMPPKKQDLITTIFEVSKKG